MKSEISPAKQLTLFLGRFSPDIIKLAKAARAKLRKRLPGAIEMVYDNYNALVIGYSPTERPSDAILSLVIWPRKVSICFIQGKHLPDPQGVLQGDGNQVRFIRLDAGAAILDTPAIRTLVSEAIAFGETPFRGKGLLVIRSISKKQRPRR
jgi:hypothetical protein